ncbi:AMP-binding protein [Halothiobacillus sp. DCM-1]|uniref:AMP-binding protein n=1 Tax=Halothiobacillus sp. DCM-1 TaxID=3112558 RepID=UPI00324AB4D9
MSQRPLLGHPHPDAVLCYRDTQPVTAGQFLQEAQTLARALRALPGGEIIHLCQDRYRFLLGFAAVLLAGKTNLLPANDTAETLRQLHTQFPAAFSLHDRADWPHPYAAFAFPDEVFNTSPDPRDAADWPSLPADHVAAWVFTSGSTGQPVGHRKTWGKLWQNITAARTALGLDPEPGRDHPHHLLGTVPPQHMYGFESLVLLCLIGACPLWCGKPFYPADILAALDRLPRPRQLVTTPYHLRLLLEADLAPPPVDQLLLATAPLDPALAARAERAFGAPLHEIYGSTETGQIALRRPTQSADWQLLPGVELQPVAPNRYRASGGHIEQPVELADHLDRLPDGRFRLLGRVADQVNIAGKRNSLSHLSAQLKAIDGVLDGVYFQPDDHAASQTRLCALVVAPSRTVEELRAELRQRIDPVFLPRPLILRDALPYNATGKLPRAALLAALAEYRHQPPSHSDGFCLPAETPLFAGHFPGNPLVPGALLLDWFLGAVQAALHAERSALGIEQAKFLHPVRPGVRVEYRLDPLSTDRWRFTLYTPEQAVVQGILRRLSPDHAG